MLQMYPWSVPPAVGVPSLQLTLREASDQPPLLAPEPTTLTVREPKRRSIRGVMLAAAAAIAFIAVAVAIVKAFF